MTPLPWADVPFGSVDLLDMAIHTTGFDDAIDFAEQAIRQRQRATVCHVNVHSLIESRRDPELKQALAHSSLRAADGMPLVWLSRRQCRQPGQVAERLYGPDFLNAMLQRTSQWTDRRCRHFFYGSTPEVLEKLTTQVQRSYPTIDIAGQISPPFRPLSDDEQDQHLLHINHSKADVLWVGLGAPRQEKWVARHHHRLNVPLISAVGAAFDFLAGHKKQAPVWMQKNGLEWLFRLGCEPKRLAGRYATTIPQFVALLALSHLRRR